MLLQSELIRERMSDIAARHARDRSDPEACVHRYLEVFEVARDHARRHPARQPLRAYRSLASWTWLHTLVGTLGLLRKPVELNRNHAATGTWTIAPAA
jgi:hypothetical protein